MTAASATCQHAPGFHGVLLSSLVLAIGNCREGLKTQLGWPVVVS